MAEEEEETAQNESEEPDLTSWERNRIPGTLMKKSADQTDTETREEKE
jgi:hypothetical protein